jgi:hypothetical protein
MYGKIFAIGDTLQKKGNMTKYRHAKQQNNGTITVTAEYRTKTRDRETRGRECKVNKCIKNVQKMLQLFENRRAGLEIYI